MVSWSTTTMSDLCFILLLLLEDPERLLLDRVLFRPIPHLAHLLLILSDSDPEVPTGCGWWPLVAIASNRFSKVRQSYLWAPFGGRLGAAGPDGWPVGDGGTETGRLRRKSWSRKWSRKSWWHGSRQWSRSFQFAVQTPVGKVEFYFVLPRVT